MKIKGQYKTCRAFLLRNGWTADRIYSDGEMPEGEYTAFTKQNEICIDMDNDEIVFIGDSGDFLHIPCNYYSLIGAMVVYHILPCNFIKYEVPHYGSPAKRR